MQKRGIQAGRGHDKTGDLLLDQLLDKKALLLRVIVALADKGHIARVKKVIADCLAGFCKEELQIGNDHADASGGTLAQIARKGVGDIVQLIDGIFDAIGRKRLYPAGIVQIAGDRADGYACYRCHISNCNTLFAVHNRTPPSQSIRFTGRYNNIARRLQGKEAAAMLCCQEDFTCCRL